MLSASMNMNEYGNTENVTKAISNTTVMKLARKRKLFSEVIQALRSWLSSQELLVNNDDQAFKTSVYTNNDVKKIMNIGEAKTKTGTLRSERFLGDKLGALLVELHNVLFELAEGNISK